MLPIFSFFLLCFAIVLFVPVCVFSLEVAAAVFLADRDYSVPSNLRRSGVAVVIPAHNESLGLLPTLNDIKPQLAGKDRLLVVADNCSDDTAAVARAAGADVIERDDPDRRGKGYALAYGIKHLETDPPSVVIFVDADCRLSGNAIGKLAATCVERNRPIQSLSAMVTAVDSPINTRVAEFAWFVKNYVRPKGLCNLGFPCQLMGSGMAFPWKTIRQIELGSGSLTEDLKLGLDLAMAGHAPLFCPFPGVTSDFPSTAEGLETQRMRWERGHLTTILMLWPRAFVTAIVRRDPSLLALALDLAIPPLSLLGMLIAALVITSAIAWLLGVSALPMMLTTASALLFAITGLVSWFKYGRSILPLGALRSIFPYFFGKFSLYQGIIFSRSKLHWIRTDRTKT